jgi:ubiquinone/menaquinone biosynthesis C-methylase UbiE
VNGTLYDLVNGFMERRVLEPLRTELFSDLHGEVLELGAGTGANFSHYKNAARVLVIEPDISMARRAAKKLRSSGAKAELRIADDHLLESLPAESVDAVVMTLVLCSVEDPLMTLNRAKRVLKSDGAFMLIEHVRSAGAFGRLQDVIAPLWRRLAAGCHINRDTKASLREVGFDTAALQTKTLGGISPVRQLIYGRCRQASHVAQKSPKVKDA